ncbi:4-chlorobenzoate--CoA ligase [Grifola frondosa]|uniref:4-chlorobenzoate--CoA ligase n=1 Tax=Grifola frondosa TaxID=5627 RepID=A0A1C7MBV7_GRIFR|nr:4-chlorobenzoate--CoA ligase [Grifola frondosa]
MIRRAATYIHSHYQCVEARYAEQKCSRPVTLGPTIAILASADTISYVTLMLGIMRLGLVPFPLSIRNTAAGIAHLIRTNHVLQVYVSEDAATQRLCSGAVEILEQDGWHLDVVVMMQFDQLSDLRSGTAETEPDVTLGRLDLNKVVVISHSSGSTSVPKPIFIDNRTFLQYTMIPWFGEVDFCGTVVDTMGLANMTWPVASGMIIGVFKPSIPPVIPTPENYIEGIMATDTKVLFCVPSFVEAWFCDADLIPALKSLRAIVYGGAPLNKAVGDELIKMGVAVFPSYGTTEIGTFNMFIQVQSPARLLGDGLPDVCEPIVVHTEYFKPNVINARSRDGRGAFRTKDLLQHHPQDRSRWRMYGRADDQILLSTGEKTNPVPLEMILSQDPHLAGAVIFGQGRFQNGVLVEPKDDLKFNPDDQLKLIDFRNKIWPSVERVNKSAPGHSRLMKEMILVAHPSKPFSYTAKGTPRRQMVIDTYKSEIDTLYNVVEHSAQTDIPIPTSWTTDDLLEFVRNVVRRVMMTDLPDNVDIFQYGCDSMQTTYIRNSVMHALRVSAQNTLRDIPINFVYTHPTIASLVTFMLHCHQDVVDAVKYSEDESQHVARMEAMLAKYSKDGLDAISYVK